MPYDQIKAMYAQSGALAFNPKLHVLIECHWVKTVRRLLKSDKFFVYYHKKTRNYVLAAWIIEPKTGRGPGLMDEFDIFGMHPDRTMSDPFNHVMRNETARKPSLEMLKAIRRTKGSPNVEAEYCKQLDREAYLEAVNEENSNRQEEELIKWMEQQPNPVWKKTAEQMRRRCDPFIGDDEGGAQLKGLREAMTSS